VTTADQVAQISSAFDAALVRRWLGILHGDSPGLVHICSTDDWTGKTFGNLDSATDYVRYLDGEAREGIYVRVTTLRAALAPGKRGGAADTAALPALWADLDLAGPGHAEQDLPPDEAAGRAVIAATGLPEPTLWVHSGGGLYPIWLLDKPHLVNEANAEQAKRLTKDWQRIVEHAAAAQGWRYGRGVGDLARVLRVPGSINRKEGLARPCRIISATTNRYTVEQLVDALDQAVARIAPPAPVVPAAAPLLGAPAAGYPTPRRPGRAGRRLQPARRLGPDPHPGRLARALPPRRRHLLDPPRQDHRYQREHQRLGHGQVARLHHLSQPVGGGESYSKFGAYTALAHGGDHKAAARQLGRDGYGARCPTPPSSNGPTCARSWAT
jgi:hypothetical protein